VAKKKKEEEKEEVVDNSVKSVIDKLNKDYGDTIYDGQFFLDEDIQIVPVTPGLDIGLGGGVPRGSFGILSGKEKGGKTSLALKIGANAQKLDPETHVFVFATENRFKKKNIELMAKSLGFDISRLHIVMSNANKILAAGDLLTMAEEVIYKIPRSVIIIDSYSAIATEDELTEDLIKEQRCGANKMLSKWFKRMSGPVRANKQIIIGITHIMANPSGYGAPTQEKTGIGIKYFADWKLMIKECKVDKADDDLKAYKQDVVWDVIESALAQGGARVKTFLVYELGYDDFYELASMGHEFGFIKQAASWYKLDYIEEEEVKVQGFDKVRTYLFEHPDKAQLLKDKICELWA